MEERIFQDRESQYPNRRKITILKQNANEIIADVELSDNPKEGKEGTPVNAEMLTEFQSNIINALNTSSDASSNATTALTTANSANEKSNTALSNSETAINDASYAKEKVKELATNIGDRGTSVYVDSQVQPSISFQLDPQTQINSKLTKDFESLTSIDSLNEKVMFAIKETTNSNNRKCSWATIKSQMLNLAYPVGSIYMSVNSTNPQILFGGSWEKIEDRFLLGAGTIYPAGKIGGEAMHTLSEEEMPNHSHSGKTANIATHFGMRNNNDNFGWSCGDSSGSNVRYHHLVIDTKGGGQPHENMPPYLAVYIWKRIG